MKETKQGRMREENREQLESKGQENHHLNPSMINRTVEETNYL